MGKPTVHDIAKEAGVSLATVDRVLNSRPGVREKTVDRVQGAIRKLGYVRDINAANLARQRTYRFVFLFPDAESQFLTSLAETAAGVPRLFHGHCTASVLRANYRDPLGLVGAEAEIYALEADGVAIMGNETPVVRDMIERLKEAGIAVVALVTNQGNADHFVGIDNVAAGRTAGVLMGRFVGNRPGKVAVLVNTTQSRDMVERRAGFDQVMAADFPQLVPLPSLEGRDDHKRTGDVLEACLAAHADVVGIYCVGAGTRGVTRVAEKLGLKDHVIVAHELTQNNREALQEGLIDVVITQNVGHLVRSATRILRAKCDQTSIIESQETIRIEIAIRENLS